MFSQVTKVDAKVDGIAEQLAKLTHMFSLSLLHSRHPPPSEDNQESSSSFEDLPMSLSSRSEHLAPAYDDLLPAHDDDLVYHPTAPAPVAPSYLLPSASPSNPPFEKERISLKRPAVSSPPTTSCTRIKKIKKSQITISTKAYGSLTFDKSIVPSDYPHFTVENFDFLLRIWDDFLPEWDPPDEWTVHVELDGRKIIPAMHLKALYCHNPHRPNIWEHRDDGWREWEVSRFMFNVLQGHMI